MTFELIQKKTIPAIQVELQYYQHKETGAVHFHIASSSQENVFLVGLRTVPTDSTGVAHILEHTSLCGSKKYPVRDPFFMMIRRSLNTFMNAFTSSDWTAYPFASQNKKDFNNLLDVYLDAVFFSRLDPLDFAQEGHRLEFEEPENAQSDLTFKGVVFNEMKGAMSSATSMLWDLISKNLFTQSTYHHNSGGDPACIPDLSYEQLIDFYRKHYHPSNAMFMTFGDIPATEHQSTFEEKVLQHFERSTDEVVITSEPDFTQIKSVVERYPVSKSEDMQNKAYIIMSWMLGESASHEEMLQAQLVADLLLANSASPLQHALETTKLGVAPLTSELSGLETENKRMCFVCGIEGTDVKHAEEVEKMILDVFRDVAENGVEQEKLDAVLHQLELSQREISGGSYPYGLQLMLDVLPALVHGGDPFKVLDVDASLKKLRHDCQDPGFIKNLVKKMFLDNKSQLQLVAVPDVNLQQQRIQAEKDRLFTIKESMTEQEKSDVVELSKQLKQRQEAENDPSILPKVDVADIPETITFPKKHSEIADKIITTAYAAGTNGIVFQDVAFELPALDNDLLQILPCFSSCLTEVGYGDKNYLQAQSYQSLISGGFSGYSSVRVVNGDVNQCRGYYIFSSNCLSANFSKMSQMMKDAIMGTRFDEQVRLRELISQMRSEAVKGIVYSGHVFAMNAAASRLNALAQFAHRQGGLYGVKKLCELDDSLADPINVAKLADQFKQLFNQITAMPKQFLIVSDEDTIGELKADLHTIWDDDVLVNQASEFSLQLDEDDKGQLWVVETDVNYCAKAFPAVLSSHEDAASLFVLAGVLRHSYLHTVLREQGGAYGGGAVYDSATATFRFFSYRDPRLKETLDDFDKAIEWVINNEVTPQKIEEAIFEVISGIDKPSSPSGAVKQVFYNELFGKTEEDVNQLRQRVLKVTDADLKRVAKRYLVPMEGNIAIITNQNAYDEVGDMGCHVYHIKG